MRNFQDQETKIPMELGTERATGLGPITAVQFRARVGAGALRNQASFAGQLQHFTFRRKDTKTTLSIYNTHGHVIRIRIYLPRYLGYTS